MEELLHYVWKHKIFPLQELKTSDGRRIEVLSPGIHNHDAGPDFSEAKIKIDGIEWVGNVELHVRTSDWFRHGHDGDPRYSNIILHVASIIDSPLKYSNGVEIPQFQLEVPDYIRKSYYTLIRSEHTPRCSEIIGGLPRLSIHSWMSALQIERLEMRTMQIMGRRDTLDKNWEDTLFVTIARNFGFGKNGDAFEQWAHSIPMSAVGKHRDNLFQIEAIFFGQAGLLNSNNYENENINYTIDNNNCENVNHSENSYYVKLQKEYRYLRQKFSLKPIDPRAWKFFRLRPQNFPHIRIAQLAMLYYKQQLNLSKLTNADSIEEIQSLFHTEVSTYWQTHYSFKEHENAIPTKQHKMHLSQSSLDLLVINSVAPILFAYGRYKANERLCEFAVDLWEKVKPENNHIVREWAEIGIKCQNAADTQSLIHLTHNYCEQHECLRCRFGNEFIKKTPDFLREHKI